MSIPDTISILLYKSDDGWWVAHSPTVVGAHTQGATIEETCANMGEALTLMLEEEED